jgi:hypothetical protein
MFRELGFMGSSPGASAKRRWEEADASKADLKEGQVFKDYLHAVGMYSGLMASYESTMSQFDDWSTASSHIRSLDIHQRHICL